MHRKLLVLLRAPPWPPQQRQSSGTFHSILTGCKIGVGLHRPWNLFSIAVETTFAEAQRNHVCTGSKYCIAHRTQVDIVFYIHGVSCNTGILFSISDIITWMELILLFYVILCLHVFSSRLWTPQRQACFTLYPHHEEQRMTQNINTLVEWINKGKVNLVNVVMLRSK